MELLTLSGQVVQTHVGNGAATNLPLQHVPAGTYVLRVRETSSGRSGSQRLVVAEE
ncbi:T9SS type A sorting domain-containing protein [Hymenobacter koreensis]|uniref:T9SS type A sorting domain-containing protein n=1 Tax=Hymenobacter koreensis TaxID=1084523 RepID=A0ABP8ITK4_9BACT